MSDRPARTPSEVLAIASQDSLTVRFLIYQAYPLEIYLFCTILSEVSNKWFSAKADFVLDSTVPSVFVCGCSLRSVCHMAWYPDMHGTQTCSMGHPIPLLSFSPRSGSDLPSFSSLTRSPLLSALFLTATCEYRGTFQQGHSTSIFGKYLFGRRFEI